MTATVLIIGAGDMGARVGERLADASQVSRIVLAGLTQGRGPLIAGTLASLADCEVRFEPLDGTDQGAVERLLRHVEPDLVLQSASFLSPWALVGRGDPVALALRQAGLGIMLPGQLPVLVTVMRAVKAVGYQGPVVNLSFPDVTNPILDRLGLAPTVGLGNASMIQYRVRAALRVRNGIGADLPLIRVIAHHHQVYGVMTATPPEDPTRRVRVFLGEDGARDDDLGYEAFPMAPGIQYNAVTAAAAIPLLLALLPGAAPIRYSAPAPLGLPGGYPLKVGDGEIALDLPDGVTLDEAQEWLTGIGRGDGIDSIAADGTVAFTEAVRTLMAPIDPALAAPLHPDDARSRWTLLRGHLDR